MKKKKLKKQINPIAIVLRTDMFKKRIEKNKKDFSRKKKIDFSKDYIYRYFHL